MHIHGSQTMPQHLLNRLWWPLRHTFMSSAGWLQITLACPDFSCRAITSAVRVLPTLCLGWICECEHANMLLAGFTVVVVIKHVSGLKLAFSSKTCVYDYPHLQLMNDCISDITASSWELYIKLLTLNTIHANDRILFIQCPDFLGSRLYFYICIYILVYVSNIQHFEATYSLLYVWCVTLVKAHDWSLYQTVLYLWRQILVKQAFLMNAFQRHTDFNNPAQYLEKKLG